jgi:uncharacterized protein
MDGTGPEFASGAEVSRTSRHGVRSAESPPSAGSERRRPVFVPKPPWSHRLRSGLAYAGGELLADIGGWLFLGILLAGVIGALVPETFVEAYLGGGWAAKLAMLVLGLPLYVCATASTPVVAALAMKGLSPGAALVFLLAGPATNAATVTVLVRTLGKGVTAVYLLAIAGAALLLGWGADALYGWFGLDTARWVSGAEESDPGMLHWVSAILLTALTLRPWAAERRRNLRAILRFRRA